MHARKTVGDQMYTSTGCPAWSQRACTASAIVLHSGRYSSGNCRAGRWKRRRNRYCTVPSMSHVASKFMLVGDVHAWCEKLVSAV